MKKNFHIQNDFYTASGMKNITKNVGHIIHFSEHKSKHMSITHYKASDPRTKIQELKFE